MLLAVGLPEISFFGSWKNKMPRPKKEQRLKVAETISGDYPAYSYDRFDGSLLQVFSWGVLSGGQAFSFLGIIYV